MSKPTQTQLVQTQIDTRGVATVTLNRADKHNAFDDEMITELKETFLSLSANPIVRALILASEGKSFSAGADLAWMKRMADYSEAENIDDAKMLATMLHALDNCPFPTIAKVQGAAYGGAVGLISCCDMAFGSERAKFSLSEVKIGLVPATISPYVVRAIGERQARRYFCSAELFDASKAQAIGLLHEVVALENLDTEVENYVDTLLKNSPQGMRLSKQVIQDVANKAIDSELIQVTSELIAKVRVSDEGQQGLQAFLNKEAPNWLTRTDAGKRDD